MEDINYEESGDNNFVRMSLQDFEIILEKVEPEIKKMNTNFREAITARERLSVTLRFLATGDSYTSLQYLFRISKQSISTIIIEVCDAIIKALKDHVKFSYCVPFLDGILLFQKLTYINDSLGAISGI
ncbi:hypothetical protein ABMA27_008838 [Loxostege sticticalis]|uniref:Nuclease HARBI1 n=1 Tax=Loxostege sticticalis TaxID=481309 RepID=A0ABR3H916_LOXSC